MTLFVVDSFPQNYRFIVRKNQYGLTIVELMISLTLGLLIFLVAMTLLLSTKAAYELEDDVTRINDTGRFAIDTVSRAIRQTSYRNWDQAEGLVLAESDIQPAMFGLDASSQKSNTIGIELPVAQSVNGSDVLALRYFGIGMPQGDGSVVNCAGFSVGATLGASRDDVIAKRGWSIFYVAADAVGEPELRCKYEGKSGWTSDAIARGVESFQVLYGLDTDGDGLPNRFLNASALNALDAASMSSIATSAINPSAKSHWLQVVEVSVALLIRGAQDVRSETPVARFDLFGADYGNVFSARDPGTVILKENLPIATRRRTRKVFRFSVQVRPQAVARGLNNMSTA